MLFLMGATEEVFSLQLAAGFPLTWLLESFSSSRLEHMDIYDEALNTSRVWILKIDLVSVATQKSNLTSLTWDSCQDVTWFDETQQ